MTTDAEMMKHVKICRDAITALNNSTMFLAGKGVTVELQEMQSSAYLSRSAAFYKMYDLKIRQEILD